ncbi:NUDIX domain-containing protein [Cryobacterium sp. CG_9.6]|uniref:NUDIX hydrolase n=1 Tax=Cryobacterium sp. CG_9.6 TaxID=2760710 RepID=UPI002474A80A|nr:NUDIX domain-containing protein [Cryobacterium sp. CG_9.6]MDH6235731.1 8-oxo-dGTP pyrophosphatase MutT (NUDIX family) [Cryobacterium sp. CG_9.6]
MKRDEISAEPALPMAATVVLLRDGAAGLEVLLLERPHHRGSFAGAWVFPGGAVDPEDFAPDQPAAEQPAAERAARREVLEETSLRLVPGSLVVTACWIPPASTPKRLRTWFYWSKAPAGTITLPSEEAVDHVWLRPQAALDRHASGTMRLFPPTWVTLNALTPHSSVDAALHAAGAGEVALFESRFGPSPHEAVLFWQHDVAFADSALFEADGPRHRLETGALPWVYTRALV